MKKIILKCIAFIMLCSVGSLHAQTRQVSGVVKDNSGESLPGVSVTIKGTTIGMITAVDGKYTLKTNSENDVLVFSYIGYESKEMKVGNQSTINVTLNESAENLEEIVVVGYGSQKKSQLTGAISTVKARDLTDLPLENTQQGLQGRVAGVDVMQAGSKPGTEPRVVIRGRRSFNASNDPLFVVDGIPISNDNGVADINPNDIASMEILKDASATAIYGSRGANGVVLISTKRGKSGKGTVTYDTYIGTSQALDIINLMNGEQFAAAKREAFRPVGGNFLPDEEVFQASELEGLALGRSEDYVAGILQTGTRMNHQLGFSGGNENTQFFTSFGFFRDQGIIPGQDFTRSVLRINLDHRVAKFLKIGISSSLTYSVRNGEGFNPLGGAMRENPLGKTYNDDGTLNFLPTEDGLRSNPYSEIVPGAIVDRRKINRTFAGIYAELDIAKGLRYRFNFGPDFKNEKRDRFQGTLTNARRLAPAAAQTDNFDRFNYTLENILTYDKPLFKNHNLNITALQSLQQDTFERNGISVEGIPSETQQFNNLGNASIIRGVGSNLEEWTLLSYMGRINYGINEKYLITATIRADGSSRFGANTKWGYFPSVALAWNISDEAFIKELPQIDLLKLRTSYGSIGNQAIDPYQTQGLLSQRAYNFGDNAAFGYAPNTIANPDLKWETSTSLNVGLDFSFFRGKVQGSLEYYDTQTSDLLLSRNLPTSTGFTAVTANIGGTRNSGFEATVSTINVDNAKGFKWSTDFTFFTNKEQITELYGGTQDDIGNGWFIGQPLSVIFDFEKIGIWQLNEADEAKSFGGAPGEIRIKDQNNDGVINAEDRIIQGSGVPKFSGGITNRISYKNFDFSAFVFARVGQKIRSNYHTTNNTLFGRYNNIVVDYWTAENPTNEFPKPNVNQEFPKWNSSLNIFDGSFVKIRNINLGYTFNSAVANKLGMSSLRLYSSIQQPFIFSPFISKYSGSDPETDIDASLDGNVTPATWTATIGINVKF